MPYNKTLSDGNLLRDTQVRPEPARRGRYRAYVAPAFTALSAQGGSLVTMALRAVMLELDRPELDRPGFAPLSAHAMFCEPVPAGPVEIDVQLLRIGRTVCQACVQLRVKGSDAVAVHVTTTFARAKTDPPAVFDQRVFPRDVPPPQELADPVIPAPVLEFLKAFRVHYQSEFKLAVGKPGWESDWKPAEGRFSVWTRMHQPPMGEDGVFDPFCYPYFADVVQPAVVQALGPEAAMTLHMPTLNFDIQFLRATRSEWLLHDVRSWEALDGFVHGTVELWDTERRLVAVASQRALVRTL